MNNNTSLKHSATKRFFRKNYLVFRYIYLLFLIAAASFGIANMEFIDKSLETSVYIVCYAFGIVSVITLFMYDLSFWEILIMIIIYPILMFCSPMPYETIYLILMPISALSKFNSSYKNEYKKPLFVFYLVCLAIGILCFWISLILIDSSSTPVSSSIYSDNGKYRIDYYCGSSSTISLYQVYGDTFQRFNRRLYGSGEGATPTFEWIDNDHVKINESIIDIHSDETYN